MECFKMKSKGFTLIELLVVIAIIGVLATIVLVSLNNARQKGRDAKKLQEIKRLQLALDMYYDKNGTYPVSGNCAATIPNGGWCNSIQSISGNYWIRDGSMNLSEFLSKDPTDPQPANSANWTPVGGGTYFYFANGYGGSGQWYMIVFGLENTGNSIQATDGVTACDGYYFDYGSGSDGVVTLGRNCQRR